MKLNSALHGRRALCAWLVVFLICLLSFDITLAEKSLHLDARLRFSSPQALVQSLADTTASQWQEVSIPAKDGTLLAGWLIVPSAPQDRCVILLHGVGDTRQGMLKAAKVLLSAGYAVLLPDHRGHGTSGGALITYGLKEAADVQTWEDWLCRKQNFTRLYGLGESLGAAVLLQSLALQPKFRAVVAECSFTDFPQVAYDRIGGALGIREGWRGILFPVVEPALLWARWRYDLPLRNASPLRAVAASTVPLLLIHGVDDTHIPLSHSRLLRLARKDNVDLWEVPATEHVGAIGTHPEEFTRRVVSWFAAH